ncbi:MAG: cysteine desulfurase [Actinomycetales bacterium]|nr:cysteine desulfurase [Actinomycetales bacterium]
MSPGAPLPGAEVYLDHAATTPVRPAALAALTEVAGRVGNPSSTHGPGRAARRTVEEARELVADRLGAHPTEVVLTGGGTEADNLAVCGLYWARTAADPRRRRVVVSAVEHHAVLDPARWLAERAGAELVLLPVDAAGRVEPAALEAELAAHGDETALVSVMWANNEVGTVQPVAEVAHLARAHGVPVHADAVQAVGQVPVDLAASGLDALTVSAHKVGGPVGVGALLLRRDVAVAPVLHGGGQERGVRSGTVPAALAAAFAAALDAATADLGGTTARLAVLRDRLVAGVLAAVPDAVVRGAWPPGGGDAPARLPANAHVTIPGCDSEALLFLLDRHGIAASAGSACRAGVQQPSHVLSAMGVPDADSRGALRLTLGWISTDADVDALLAVIGDVVARARAASAVR